MHSEEARQAEAAAAEARAPDIPLLDGTTATAPTTAQPAQPAGAPAGGFPAPELTHLILVAGHAVYTGLDFAVANKESSWFLEPYQQVSAWILLLVVSSMLFGTAVVAAF